MFLKINGSFMGNLNPGPDAAMKFEPTKNKSLYLKYITQ
jgi:hypothetical protein